MKYTATVTREGDDWLGEVEGLSGAHAYARTLTRLREELSDAVILAADLDDDADVDIVFDLAEQQTSERSAVFFATVTQAFEVAKRRAALREEECRLVADTADVARKLVEAGWSVRDVAGALDVTPGRISQLVNN
jgi:hypothetical protein